jgi:soluble lytic murein transglycosylase
MRINNFFCTAAIRGVSVPRRMERFYPALLALSLMLGKISLLHAQPVPAPVPNLSATATSAPVVKPADSAPVTPPALFVAPTFSALDKDFQLARDAFEKRDLKTLGAVKDRLSQGAGAAHPLHPYAQYWWLTANLAQTGTSAIANAAEIQAFLKANPNSVAGDSLRRDWLKILGKLDQWELFATEIALLDVEDAEINCHHWRYRLGRDDRDALSEAKSFWSAARAAPDACDDVFARLATEKLLPASDIWMRVRGLLENNHLSEARKSAALAPNVPATFERATALIGQNPAQYLQREKLLPSSQASVELFLFAVTRLARTDADRAATLLEQHGKKLPANELGYAWAQVGLYGAMQHDTVAPTWFVRTGTYRLNDTQAGWKIRAALRAGDWATVRTGIEGLSEATRRESAWRYWLARATDESGNADAARTLRETLARENNFYGVLAAEELGTPSSPNWQGWKPSRAEIDAAVQRPPIARALAFYRLDMKNEGLREWQYGIRNLDDRQLLAAAEAAHAANVPDRAINTAERTLLLHDFAQRFPTPHRTDLAVQARAQGLDEAWVYGLIRQESRFIADAKSRVGAMGLMQLMPATAIWAAKRTSMDRFSLAKAVDVPVNLSLGSYYLRHVLDDLGHPVLATAGYNAGPGRARRWRAASPLEGAIYAETIPFTETRDYVKKVMVNAWFYAQQAGATTRRLKEMMGTVPGTSAGSTGASSLVSVALKNQAP